jgi:predicted MPP superfamily phosphohydrolase
MTSWFALCSGLGWALVVAGAALFRNRFYAAFAAVVLGVHTLVSVALAPAFAWAAPLYAALQASVYVHFLGLVQPRMRPRWYRWLISVPASFFVAGTLLGLPWAVLHAVGFQPIWPWLPYALALLGAIDTLLEREEVVDIVLDGTNVAGLRRTPRGSWRTERPLRIVQITDPHLGPFMSVARLRRIAERAVAQQPDLILLTGDFLTMESQGEPIHLAEALAPLASYSGRVFACRGNHDLEAPAVVASALEQAGVKLLIDESASVPTELGRVEVIGIDFRFRGRAAHVADVLARHPRSDAALRIAMLHDPGAFRHVPEGAVDLVLSGHTHGGQLGLLWLGLPSTILSALSTLPDHGLWASGTNRLYVHRGTGHYGFPLRVGVPAEHSVLHVHALRVAGADGGVAG